MAITLLREGLPWALSGLTVLMMVLAGNKHRHAWTLGLANQTLWLTWILTDRAWGLLPLTGARTAHAAPKPSAQLAW